MQRTSMIAIGLLKKIVFYIILILTWEVVYKLTVDVFHIWKSYMFPSPVDVFDTLVRLVKDKTLFVAISVSMKRLLIGYFISITIGTILGLIVVSSKYLDENLSPLILGIQTLPNICWLPFAILWYGLSENAIIFVIAIGSTFAMSIAIESSIKNINPLYISAAKTMGAKGIKLYSTVVIPAALPSVVSGMKQAWSFAWRGLMAGEMLYATTGLGQVLMVGRDLADISQVMAVMLVIVILGLLIDKIVFGNIEKSIRKKRGLENKVV